MYVQEKNIHMLMTTTKLNQKFLHSGKTMKKTFSHVELIDYAPDEIDFGIMKLLSTNARIKLRDMAHALDVDSRLIEYHVKRMERAGIIVLYTTDLNTTQLKRELIQIDIALKDLAFIHKIITFFDKTNTCLFIHEMLGKYDLSIGLYVENDEMLRNILEKFKEQFLENYMYYDVSHVYKEYVINWFPFHE
jgi:Lrp/AsnC family leucine-responsive transcriptional regulator